MGNILSDFLGVLLNWGLANNGLLCSSEIVLSVDFLNIKIIKVYVLSFTSSLFADSVEINPENGSADLFFKLEWLMIGKVILFALFLRNFLIVFNKLLFNFDSVFLITMESFTTKLSIFEDSKKLFFKKNKKI